jgi:hypothetical protein
MHQTLCTQFYKTYATGHTQIGLDITIVGAIINPFSLRDR